MALLLYVLLRFLALQSQWGQSFARLWAVTRSAWWLKLELVGLLRGYGTAGAASGCWGIRNRRICREWGERPWDSRRA